MKKLIVITLFILGFGVFGSAGGSYIFDHGVLDSYQSTLLGNNISVCDFEFNAPSYNPAGSNYSYNLSLYVLGSPDILYFSGTEEYIDNITVWNNSNSFCDIWVSPFEVYCELAIINLTDNSSYPFSDYYVYNCSTTTTTTSTTSTTTNTSTTTSTEGTTTSTGGATTSTGGVTTSVAPGTTMYGYSLPNTNYGTLPGLNGTGGITINNGTIKNMTCTGWCIIGLKKEEFTLYAAIMISLLVLFAVKPFKLGATASFVAVAFFNNILGWTVVTTSVILIYAIVAFGAWFTEGKE